MKVFVVIIIIILFQKNLKPALYFPEKKLGYNSPKLLDQDFKNEAACFVCGIAIR